ncbi:MAG: aminopeptidase [Thermoplasmata archaeon]|nr:aminopeptidase [Thermoplasmata archaeon]
MVDAESRVAHTVLAENLHLTKGDSVVIEAWTDALPYARAFVKEARRMGIRPLILYEDESAWWDAVDAKQYSTLGQLSAPETAAIHAADAYIFFWGPGDRARMDTIPESAQEKVTAYNDGWYKLAHKAGLRGCRMWVGLATDATAGLWGIDGREWRERLVAAGAISAAKMLAKGKKITKAIAQGSELTLRHPNGTDLTLQLTGAKARIDAGQVDAASLARPFGILANNPSGQVIVGLDKSAANGTFVSNRTIYVGPDRFADARFRFENGVLVEHSLGLGAAVFDKQLKAAGKAKITQSYLSIGLNPLTNNVPPCEDTEEGSVLVGAGSNVFAGGKIRIPFQGSALIGEPDVSIDGKLVAKGGKVL